MQLLRIAKKTMRSVPMVSVPMVSTSEGRRPRGPSPWFSEKKRAPVGARYYLKMKCVSAHDNFYAVGLAIAECGDEVALNRIAVYGNALYPLAYV